jgi:hypothetical protein
MSSRLSSQRGALVLGCALLTLSGTSILALLTPSAALASGTWGNAQEVPGTATLNAGGNALIYGRTVSCPSSGNCSAGGHYTDSSHHQQAFVVNQNSGTWATAQEVPGSAALNAGGSAGLSAVSCASAGNCSAGGYYTDGSGAGQVFVVSETSGTWGDAQQLPVVGESTSGGFVEILSISCASAGNCSAGGFYPDSSGLTQAFVATETNGTWSDGQAVPGVVALNAGDSAQVTSVSCASAGDCSAGGSYTDSSGNQESFAATETNGTWGSGQEISGTTAVPTGVGVSQMWMSCASVGNCSAGGYYTDSSNNVQAFVVNETSGTWGAAEEVPGTATLNAGGAAEVTSMSCASVGDCSAGGSYVDSSSNFQLFVVNETSGTWGTAEEVPGTATLNAGGNAGLNSLSCASAGNCSASGAYRDSSGRTQAFVVDETSGTWAAAEEVPGTAALNIGGNAYALAVSCAPGGDCSAGGFYTDGSGHLQAFDATTAPSLAPTITSFSPTSGPVGKKVTITGTNLSGATKVTFNGIAATINSDTATQIVVHVPAGATTGKIKVKTPNGKGKSATNFTVT